jgi:hypothetical protein
MTTQDEEISEAGKQWELDHPNGISAEELASMDRYAYESCREEHGEGDHD